MREIAEQREDAQAREHPVAVGVADDENRRGRPDAGRLEGRRPQDAGGGEPDAPLPRAEGEAFAAQEQHDRHDQNERARAAAEPFDRHAADRLAVAHAHEPVEPELAMQDRGQNGGDGEPVAAGAQQRPVTLEIELGQPGREERRGHERGRERVQARID